MKRILICGLPGSGKTTLATKLVEILGNADLYNADEIREKFNDWDFTPEGRERQMKRMQDYVRKSVAKGNYGVADFVCPTNELQEAFMPEYTIFMDTIEEGRYEDTNKIFYDIAQDTNDKLLNKITNIVIPTLENLSKILILNLEKMDNNIEDLSSTCWAFSNYINTTFKDENKNIYYLIRGTIWHYMLAGYSISYSCPPDDQENSIKIWKYRFIDFLNKLPIDLKDELNKDRRIMENDPYLRKTLLEE